MGKVIFRCFFPSLLMMGGSGGSEFKLLGMKTEIFYFSFRKLNFPKSHPVFFPILNHPALSVPPKNPAI
jgi:hypothetical protein